MSNSPSHRTRFEVFKRDGFKCQYCGRTPPAVTLEIDHINPKSKGGLSNITNYITACYDCNRGKSDITLSSIPPSLQTSITELKERKKQLEAYSEFLIELEGDTQIDIDSIDATFQQYFPKKKFSPSFRNGTIRAFLRQLPVVKICEAIHIAGGRIKDNDLEMIRYFCGICWNWIKHPDTRGW